MANLSLVYYNWSRQFRDRSFQSQRKDQTQRFYFNASPGSVLPGQTKLIPIVFESPNGGKFTECWNLNFRPNLGTFNVILRGCSQSLQPEHDDNLEARGRIEKMLERQQAKSAASHVISKILAEVKTPPRCPSPDDIYFTEADRFEMVNRGLHYSYVVVRELDEIWSRYETTDEWDLNLKSLRQKLIDLSENCEDVEQLEQLENEQKRLNELCREMYQRKTAVPALTSQDYVKMQINSVIERITSEYIQMRRKMNIGIGIQLPFLRCFFRLKFQYFLTKPAAV